MHLLSLLLLVMVAAGWIFAPRSLVDQTQKVLAWAAIQQRGLSVVKLGVFTVLSFAFIHILNSMPSDLLANVLPR
ncbi:MAG: hypothetical protein WCA07_10290 [Gloeobacterales cyanobacterium]